MAFTGRDVYRANMGRYTPGVTPAPKRVRSVAFARAHLGIPRSIGAGPVMAGRYSSSAFRRGGEEVKTLDLQFTGNYAAGYTVDTQPQQALNLNSNTASVQAFSLIQQGAGISQRIGNKVSLKSLRLRLRLVATGNAQTSPIQARVMVLYDRNPNGAYTAANSILSTSLQANTIGAGTADSEINPNFMERFVCLMDRYWMCPTFDAAGLTNTIGPTGEGQYPWIINEYVKLRNLEVIYTGTANPMTIAYHTTGALMILTYSTVAAGADPWCLMGSARLRFRDN